MDGKRVPRRLFSGKYRLPGDSAATVVALGVTDKRVAQQKLDEIVRQRENERAGLAPRKLLVHSAQRTLADHLKEFLADLKQSACAKYVQNIRSRATRIINDCAWKCIADLNASAFVVWRSNQKQSPETLNQYLDSLNVLLNWMERHERIEQNPLKRVGKLETRGKEVRKRRAFTDNEMRRILAAADDKSLAIRTMYLLGLRRREAKLLQWGDIDLEAGTVQLRSSTAKNKMAATMPLDDLAPDLKAIRPVGVKSNAPVLAHLIPTMDEWRQILEKAEIPYKDDQGRQGDVHSLRYTLCTNLACAGVPVPTAMLVMRHSDIKLTTAVYLDAGKLPTGDARRLIPRFATPVLQPERSLLRSPSVATNGHSASSTDTLDNAGGNEKTPEMPGVLVDLSAGDTKCHADAQSSASRTRSHHFSALAIAPDGERSPLRSPAQKADLAYLIDAWHSLTDLQRRDVLAFVRKLPVQAAALIGAQHRGPSTPSPCGEDGAYGQGGKTSPPPGVAGLTSWVPPVSGEATHLHAKHGRVANRPRRASSSSLKPKPST